MITERTRNCRYFNNDNHCTILATTPARCEQCFAFRAKSENLAEQFNHEMFYV